MGTVAWLMLLAAGLCVAVVASHRAIGHLTLLAAATGVPPFLIGITVVSLGTDLPEIANSVASSATGHGDINVGDSVGSAAIQATLVLGLLPFIAGSFPARTRGVAPIGVAAVLAPLLGAALLADGRLGRAESLALLALWGGTTAVVWRRSDLTAAAADMAGANQPVRPRDTHRHLVSALLALGLVAAGALLAVRSMTELASAWSVPEYLVAFLLASLGTSLPEVTVAAAALRRQQWDLAVGNVLGASLADSTLSLALGPLLFPITVTAGTAVTGSLAAAAAVAVATLLLTLRPVHGRRSGAVLLATFLLVYLVVGTR